MSGFDAHRPPEQSVIDDCVHCGFCLDSCPTYTLWSDEADSPRGRIVLMAEALADGGELSEEIVTHFDRCLGCMGCVSACPSGVAYDRLIERVRPQVERHHARPRAERAFRRLLFETLPHPGRMRVLALLLAATRGLPVERLDERLAMAAKVAPRASARDVLHTRLPTHVRAVGERRGRVGLLLGCVQRVFFADVHRATIATLAAEGFDVYAPRLPACCGALEFHAGAEDAAIARARKTIAAFADVNYVVTSAAGCGSAMKDYGQLIEDAPARLFSLKVRDVSELLASVDRRTPRGPVPLRVAYHDACHLAHAQGIREEPRELLRAIPGLELLEVAHEPQICCGSAGIYNLVQPEAAAELGARKAASLLETGAEAIAAGNPGCAAQIDLHLREAGQSLPIYHPIELLWRSIRAGR
ncbi:MAG: glycolate oxidase iron-sulfur subunit [Solirubrobacteraceae bacterium]|nr:glycolate oxidase iron-sulfur subunit [Solirubrobacteraceae bacterium]